MTTGKSGEVKEAGRKKDLIWNHFDPALTAASSDSKSNSHLSANFAVTQGPFSLSSSSPQELQDQSWEVFPVSELRIKID